MSEALGKLIANFRRKFPAKADEFRALQEALNPSGPTDTEQLSKIRDKAHHEKGAFGMCGFARLYELCESIEEGIASRVDLERVSRNLEELVLELEKQSSPDA